MCYRPFSELYTQVYHRTAIEAALRLLPQGLSASLTAITLT
jgi:electron transfer flavoprotein alpha/beta subunit